MESPMQRDISPTFPKKSPIYQNTSSSEPKCKLVSEKNRSEVQPIHFFGGFLGHPHSSINLWCGYVAITPSSSPSRQCPMVSIHSREETRPLAIRELYISTMTILYIRDEDGTELEWLWVRSKDLLRLDWDDKRPSHNTRMLYVHCIINNILYS